MVLLPIDAGEEDIKSVLQRRFSELYKLYLYHRPQVMVIVPQNLMASTTTTTYPIDDHIRKIPITSLAASAFDMTASTSFYFTLDYFYFSLAAL